MSKGKVLMVISNYRGYQGHEIVINNLCNGLNKIGYSTAIGAFSFSQNPPWDIEKVKLNRFRNLPSNSNRDGYDIFHIHQGIMNYYSLLMRKPIVFHFHGTNARIQEINLKVCMMLCRNRISKVVSISQAA